MKDHRWLKVSVVALALLVLGYAADAALADGGPLADDQDLAERYAPVLYFHPDEPYRPQHVDVMVDTARLRQARPHWLDVNVLLRVSVADLASFTDSSYALDAWYGDLDASPYRLPWPSRDGAPL